MSNVQGRIPLDGIGRVAGRRATTIGNLKKSNLRKTHAPDATQAPDLRKELPIDAVKPGQIAGGAVAEVVGN